MASGGDFSFHGNEISGGTINHGQYVQHYQGYGGESQDAVELRRRLDELQRLLVQYAAVLPDADRLREDTEELGTQLQRERPNRSAVRGLLDSLTAGAGGVSAVLAAVTGLTQFVGRFLP
ncbi:DUF5955 family protein [Streptomyces sp. NPDC002928]|uniref:DUF5955 family protein n=1 Tax=Streptomyces sp. NPDC002928 TaxID=3154440 RepID=UPI0033B786FB